MNYALQVIVAGLTYNGSLLHIFINYSLIALTLVPFLAPGAHGSSRLGYHWAPCFLIALAVQILLWFIADAVGVSVIWATMAGYSLVLRTTRREAYTPDRRRLLTVALVSALIGIVYYAVTLPFITTVAHVIAVLLGIGIFSIVPGRFRRAQKASQGRAR